MKIKFILHLLIALSVLWILAACENDEAGADGLFYDNEDLETIIPYDAGGGTDVLGRFFAPFLSEHIDGNPSVQVTNIPGAGSVIGMNEYTGMRKADGYNAIWTSGSTITNHLLQTEGVDYEFQDLTPILGVPDGGVVFISAETGYETPEDLLNLDGNLIYSGQSATGLDLVPLLAFEVLDMDVQALLGYEGGGPGRVAFEQGESNLNFQTTSAYLSNVEPLVEEGSAIPLFSFGHFNADGNIIRDPAFPDLPNLKEFYEEVYDKEPSGPEWEAYQVVASRGFTIPKVLWTKNETPEEAVLSLQEGAESLLTDPDFIEEGKEVLGGYNPVAGEELVDLIATIIQTDLDPEIEAWIFDYLAEEHGE